MVSTSWHLEIYVPGGALSIEFSLAANRFGYMVSG
jgi:hypothetical protein